MGKKDRRRDGLAPPRDAACQRGSGGKGRLLGRVLYFFAAVSIRSFDCNSIFKGSTVTQTEDNAF